MRDHAVAQSRALFFVRAAYIIRKGKECRMQYIHVKYFRKTAISITNEFGDSSYDSSYDRVGLLFPLYTTLVFHARIPLAGTMISFFFR